MLVILMALGIMLLAYRSKTDASILAEFRINPIPHYQIIALIDEAYLSRHRRSR